MVKNWYNFTELDWYGFTEDDWYSFLESAISNVNIYKIVSDGINDSMVMEDNIILKLRNIEDRLSVEKDVVGNLYVINFIKNVQDSIVYSQNAVEVDKELQNSVFSLNSWVVDNFGDLNQYLYSNSILVKPRFAYMSDKLGFTIE